MTKIKPKTECGNKYCDRLLNYSRGRRAKYCKPCRFMYQSGYITLHSPIYTKVKKLGKQIERMKKEKKDTMKKYNELSELYLEATK